MRLHEPWMTRPHQVSAAPAWRLAMLLAAYAAPIALLALVAAAGLPRLGALYLPLHTAAEVCAVVVAALIFATGWHSFDDRAPPGVMVLSSAFFAVGLFDLGHLLSVPGMPDFVTPASVSKGIAFWLAARGVGAAALLAAALLPWRRSTALRLRHATLAVAAALVALVYWLVLLRPDLIGQTYIPGHGLTPLKVGIEYALIVAYLLAAALLLPRALRPCHRGARQLALAAAVMALSELCFTLYVQADDCFNCLGHVYKLIACGYLYRAIFVRAVQQPYQRLQRSEQALAESESQFRSLMECAPDAIVLVDAAGAIVLMNARAEVLFGVLRVAAAGTRFDALVPGAAESTELICRRASGDPFPAEVSRARLQTAGGALLIAIVRDISERRRAAEEKERLLAILEATPDVISMVDTEQRTLYLNRAGRALSGLAQGEARDCAAEQLLPPWVRALLREEGRPAALRDGCWSGEAALRRADGGELPVSLALLCHKDAAGQPAYWSTICRDVSERRRFERQLLDQLRHDALTGLPNRVRVIELLGEAMRQARQRGAMLALLLLDLDFFKKVNDSFGHAEGDAVLRACVARLTAALRAGDTLARQGGGEFIIVQHDVGAPRRAAQLAEALLRQMREPFYIQGHAVFLGASIGIALMPQHELGADALLNQAHVAMSQVKRDGRDGYCFHAPDMDRAIQARLRMESELRHAIAHGELTLHYQPRVRLDGGAMIGVEALLRWNHPLLGVVAPAQFIPVAEESGLIESIGMWVLEQACLQACRWREQGLPPLCVSVNLSARQFQQAGLARRIGALLARTGLDPACLELELTESTVMRDTQAAVNALGALKQLGVALSIDDFGTGYSSLSYLKLFPIDVLKIDRSFVKDVITDPDDAAITRAIVALAHGLDLEVVAEGVETVEQARFLRALGCDAMQGYYLSRPVAPEQLAVLLIEGHTEALADSWADGEGAHGR